MEIGVSTHRAQLGHAALFDGDPAGEVLVAVEQAGRPVQRVSRVVDGRTFLDTHNDVKMKILVFTRDGNPRQSAHLYFLKYVQIIIFFKSQI